MIIIHTQNLDTPQTIQELPKCDQAISNQDLKHYSTPSGFTNIHHILSLVHDGR